MTFVHEQLRKGTWVAPWLRFQNLTRYQWAATFCHGQHVVEIGCGSGLGTKLLSDAGAARVDGYDVAEDAVRAATETYGNDRLHFHLLTPGQIPVSDESFDVCVSLETIEHIDDTDTYLAEIARVLRPHGVFLCSTPNRTVTNPATVIDKRPYNPHHIREFTDSEFVELIQTRFDRVQLLGQSAYGRAYVALLTSAGRIAPRAAVRIHQIRKVLGIPLDRVEKHYPREVPPHKACEVSVVHCLRK